jgi:ribosomal protein S21
MTTVRVHDNDVKAAVRRLKRRLEKEGALKIYKRRYGKRISKPSELSRLKRQQAARRRQKRLRRLARLRGR